MQLQNYLKIRSSLLSGIVLAALIASGGNSGVVRAETNIDKRVEEFKTGIHKTDLHSKDDAAATAADDDGKKKPAAHASEKKDKPASHTPVKKVKSATAKGHGDKSSAAHAGEGEHVDGLDADDALKRLLEGNRRYASGKAKGPNRSSARRAELAKSQHPIAVVVSCSDSRVPPELLFDQGFGDIFVVRTAGNIVDSIALGSIEYAVDHLGAKLILVLGHERCGAVSAALQGGDAPGNIKALVEAIKPAIEKGKALHTGHGELSDTCIKSNVKLVAGKIRTTAPILSEAVENGMLKVVGAYYDLDSGMVNMTYMPN